MPGAAWRIRAVFAGVLALLSLSACAPRLQPSGPFTGSVSLAGDAFIARDGARLPLRVWRPDGPPRVVVAALHGFNDYSKAFEDRATAWAARGIVTYAFDQRGFAAGPEPGIWAGTEAMTDDMARAILGLYRGGAQPFLRDLGDRLAAADRPRGLLINATGDPYVPSAGSTLVAARLGVEELMLPDAGHWWAVTHADAAATGLLAFWASLD